MRITVKVLKLGKVFDVEVQPQDSGRSLVQKVAAELAVAPELVRIIANMTVLKEALTLEENKITEGSTVQATVKAGQPIQVKETVLPQVNVGKETDDGKSAPAAAADAGRGAGMMGLMRDPELMKQMMQNPMMQQIYENPELMKQMIQGNPIIQKMIEQHPELQDVFEDPAALQMMKDMGDPAKMDEILRQQDQAMANLQNVPGGLEMLQRYQEDLGSLMEQELKGHGQGQAGTQKEEPNWFLPEQKAQPQAPGKRPETSAEETPTPLPKSYLQLIRGTAAPSSVGSTGGQTTQSGPSTFSRGAPAAQANQGGFGFPGMPGMPGMDNPAAMQVMMNDPMIQQLMDQMADDPATFNAYMNNPVVKQQLQAMTGGNPMLEYLFQNPEMLRQQFKAARDMMRGGSAPGFNPPRAQNSAAGSQGTTRPAQPTQAQAAQQSAAQTRALQVLKNKWAPQLELIKGLGIQADEATVLQLLEMFNGNVEQVVNQLFDTQ